jgi:hypothetical protein
VSVLFSPPTCSCCKSVLYVEQLLQDPDTPEWDIDWQEWTCIVCRQCSGYFWSVDGEDRFRLHVDMLREMARRARDTYTVP